MLAVIYILLFFAISTSEYKNNNYCHKDNFEKEQCATYDVMLVFFWKIGKFLDEHNGAISAISGLIVAGFTGTLWWVTWGLVRVANDQRIDSLRSIDAAVRAAIAAEGSIHSDRAWITFDGYRITQQQDMSFSRIFLSF